MANRSRTYHCRGAMILRLSFTLVMIAALALSGCIGNLSRSEAELLLRQYADQYMAEDWDGLAGHFALPATIGFHFTSRSPHLFYSSHPHLLPTPPPDCHIQHTMSSEHDLSGHDCSVLLGLDSPIKTHYYDLSIVDPGLSDEHSLAWIHLYEGELLTTDRSVVSTVLKYEYGSLAGSIIDADVTLVDAKESGSSATGKIIITLTYEYLEHRWQRVNEVLFTLRTTGNEWKIASIKTIKTKEISLDNDLVIF